ncbi:MAG: LysR family transcriptional regulator [Pseudomonadota bacterium]
MKAAFAWSDLALFAAVARAGGLAPAAAETGTSPATLSRRMRALETQAGRQLFAHGARGYVPTSEGRMLLDRIARMETTAAEIEGWRATAFGPARVRISAGTWTGLAVARDLPSFWGPDEIWMPEFLHCNAEMDIARREIDIGIRNRRPDSPWLAGRRTATIQFAAYATAPAIDGWITLSPDAPQTRSAAWVRARHGGKIVSTANEPQLALAMAEAGIGRVVLPIFVGETRTALMRVSDPIADLQSEEWLVSHHEARHEPPIRAALDALARYLTSAARRAELSSTTRT